LISVNYLNGLNTALLLFLMILGGCATPSQPTGGPRDEEGPQIIRTKPETGTTNFSGRSITLEFSEFVERSSLNQAIVVEPDIGIGYDLDWGRKSVAIEFDQKLPDLTTLIVTIGTDFKDVNGNKMAKPQKVAVSTGPEIDEGKLFGRVVDAGTGKKQEGQRILLYREPYELGEKANYIASTDTSGQFQFSYLREGTYKAFWVDDRNRNKIWDPQQERAQPFSSEFVTLEKAGADTIGTVYVTSVDTTQPSLQGVGLFSSRRLRMRFSENIQLSDSAAITITDTLGNPSGEAYPLYLQPGEPYILFAQSTMDLSPDESYSMNIAGITDMAENELKEVTQDFTGSAQEDTTLQRIIERNTTSGYYPEDPFLITYAQIIDAPEITDSLKIVEGDTLIEQWPNLTTDRNMLQISPRDKWKDGVSYEIRVWDPKIEDYRKFQPEIWHGSQMGSLNIMLEDSSQTPVRLQLTNKESGIARDTVFTGSLKLSNLPPLNYQVIAYIDENDNGDWDYGSVSPFAAPEPYFIQNRVPVKKGMTGDLTIIFQN